MFEVKYPFRKVLERSLVLRSFRTQDVVQGVYLILQENNPLIGCQSLVSKDDEDRGPVPKGIRRNLWFFYEQRVKGEDQKPEVKMFRLHRLRKEKTWE